MKKNKFLQVARSKLVGRDGEILTHTVLTIIVYFVCTVLVINLLIMTFHFFALHYSARAVARNIEREGGYSINAERILDDLNENFHTAAYIDNSIPQKIQYRDSFEVRLVDEHILKIASPMGLEPILYLVPMSATITGMSEVYWKDL